MPERAIRLIKKIIPAKIFKFFQPFYHWALAWCAAFVYFFPARKLKVIGVTGTNGKSTVVHLISEILEEAGEKVASVSSLRFRLNKSEKKNTLKMTMPGRFRLQKFLRSAVRAGCKYAVVEVTSEGIKQYRHIGINFYMAVLTNVTPEHIESHGSFEAYRAAKAELFRKAPIHILNGEDPSIEYFLKIFGREKVVYTKKDLPAEISLKLIGDFNRENAVAAYHVAKFLGVESEIIKNVLERIKEVPGRLEFVQREPFSVVVDYAHTPDALRKVYETLRLSLPTLGVGRKLICVLGAAGGGRDKWKRPEFGKIAAEFCDEIILTNEDPYDEDPVKILEGVKRGFLRDLNHKPPTTNYKLILDRREAIREALKSAHQDDVVIITGKGAEPWIMGPDGTKTPWDDRVVVREELAKL